jgi:hypothetical protein
MIPGGADPLGRPQDPGYDGSGNGEFTIQPTSALPVIDDPVVLDATIQTANIGDTNPAGPEVELDGSDPGAGNEGFLLQGAGGSTIRGFVINRFKEDGIEILSDGNTIEGNYIGSDVTGTLDRGNTLRGINVNGSDNNFIGGPNAGEGNLISGNDQEGLNIRNGSAANTVQGNLIGTNAAGDAALPNAWEGIQLWAAGAGNIFGGTAAGAGNVISGNGRSGLRNDGTTASGTLIRGNIIGLSAAGDVPVPNTEDGVHLSDTITCVVGGSDATYRNVISGNLGNGVRITNGANANDVRWNYIGINGAGDGTISNTLDGILIDDGTINSDVYDNWIGGNLGNGIQIDGTISGPSGNTIRSNYIGTDSTLAQDFGNTQNGIRILGVNTVNNTTGGNSGGLGNWIYNNTGDGIRIESSATNYNRIEITRTFNNGGLGINLVGGAGETAEGVTPNDAPANLDADTGANGLQNFPVMTTATWNGTTLSVAGTIDSRASRTYRINIYVSSAADASGYGEGQYFAGGISVATDGSGHGTFSTGFLPGPGNDLGLATWGAGTVATAAAWDQGAETSSELSAAFPVALPAGSDISGTVFEDVNYGGGAGRNLAAAQAAAGAFSIERDLVTVELYTAAGNYDSSTTTAADGSYSFTGLTPANYIVRVVNSTGPIISCAWSIPP